MKSTSLHNIFRTSLRWLIATLLLWCAGSAAMAQIVRGKVVDAATGEMLPVVAVRYLDRPAVGTMTDVKGRFNITLRKGRTLVFSLLGYKEQRVVVSRAADITIELEEKTQELGAVEVKQQRKKYTRKNNPAVEMMKRVIAAKRICVIDSMPYCSWSEYKRQTLSVDKFNPTAFAAARKNLGFMSQYASVNPLTGDTILPLMVDETTRECRHRRNPDMSATTVMGHRRQGINDIIATGELANTLSESFFPEVNIYDDNIRLFQLHFMSPIADNATSFYHYFIADTVMYGGRRCYEMMFLPANARDIGFSGTLHILADGTWQLQHAELNLPSLSGVNFVDRLRVAQDYDSLPGGVRTIVGNDMLISLSVVDLVMKFEVRTVSRRSNFSTAEISEQTMLDMAQQPCLPEAERRPAAYWDAARTLEASEGEKNMSRMMIELQQMRGFKALRFVVQAFGENFIETNPNNSKVDIGPVKQMLGRNYAQGVRLGVGAQTTGLLHPHIFASAFVGVGTKGWKPFGNASLAYSFTPKKLRPHEWPAHYISMSYSNDVMSAADRVEGHNRDNFFSVFNQGSSRHFMRQQAIRLQYVKEWNSGMSVKAELLHERISPEGALVFQPVMGSALPSADPVFNVNRLTNAEGKITLRYQPGTTYVTTKKKRIETNKDAPYIQVSHSFAPRGVLGTDYTSNITEVEAHKRFWMYSWGRTDLWLNAGAQWNQVPFPLLLAPVTNQTFMWRKRNLNLLNDFEFVNDRYVRIQWQWDLYGKLFNRIPLLRRLGWRENIGANVMWGTLTAKNNPATHNYAESQLWHMPGEWNDEGAWEPFTQLMDKKVPYVEGYVGISNIFSFLSVQYVHRFTYRHNPGISRWGLRFMLEMSF